MNWLFVLVDKGTPKQRWLLKIRTLPQLVAYHQEVFMANTDLPEDNAYRIKDLDLDAARKNTGDDELDKQYIAIGQGKTIYYNSKGEWDTEEHQSSNFLYRKFLEFPNFTVDDISIKSFTDGTHSYAHMKDLEVREGDTIKWDTYEEAYRACLRIICPENRPKDIVIPKAPTDY